jgi:hypothetical protein
MNRNYPSYSIRAEDKTQPQTGFPFRPATMTPIQWTDNTCSAGPTLQDVLNWIDGQVTKVRDDVNEMRRNNGTTTIVLHARLPVGVDSAGLCKHEWFSDIPANGNEIDELKHRVTAAYEKAGAL